MHEDTVAAIITRLGPSGVGIVRISGAEAIIVADRLFAAKNKQPLSGRPGYSITYGYVKDRNGNRIDEALAMLMRAPHSFTGEDVVELQCHGGSVVLRTVLERVLQEGARMAEAGEFSRRAFLNGRIDLSQAEAIMDIISAKTELALSTAAENLAGDLKVTICAWREKILELTALLEAELDFPEEDIEFIDRANLSASLEELIIQIQKMLDSYRSGRIIREGIKTVLIGRPNVGKSSILNMILNSERAIVTEIPGTTRDTIEESYDLDGIPLVLIDTAGLRQTNDKAEQIGVERTRAEIPKADLVLYVLDITEEITSEDIEIMKQIPPEKLIVLINKHDLREEIAHAREASEAETLENRLYFSAKTGTGLAELKERIREMSGSERFAENEGQLLTNVRHKEAMSRALEALKNAAGTNRRSGEALELLSIDMRQAWTALGEITGETLEEEIIDQIFARFCIGK